MKRLLKKLVAMAITACMIASAVPAYATKDDATHKQDDITFYSEEIPLSLKSGTVIKFISPTEYIILEEGEDVTYDFDEVPYKNFSDEELEILQEEEEIIKRIKEEAENHPTIQIDSPKPETGMVVTYNTLGGPKDILYPVKNSSECGGSCDTIPYFITELSKCKKGYSEVVLKEGTTLPSASYTYPAIEVNDVVIDNVITISSKGVLGEGVFSTYNDDKNEKGKAFKKGDCATKGDIDNPRHGTEIYTRRTTSDGKPLGGRVKLTKRDNGCLPQAILDVWGSGVELFGYKQNKNLSFFARYYYEK